MRTKPVRVYRHRPGFLLQRFAFIPVFGVVLASMLCFVHDGWIAFSFLGAAFAYIVYAVFEQQPLAVEIQTDFFTVKFLWKRRNFHFAQVTYVMRDEVVFRKSGVIQTVKVGLSNGHSVQLLFPSVREELYEDLATAWHIATDLKTDFQPV